MNGDLWELLSSAQRRQIARLQNKEAKGWDGWDDPQNKTSMMEALHDNIKKKQWIDVMNFAMFQWNLDGRKRK